MEPVPGMHAVGAGGDWLVAAATLVAALIGAAAGSGFAFVLENRRRHREELRLHIGAINRALFVLYRYWNELLPYRQTVIDPVREKPDGWLNASTLVAPVDGNQPIDDGNLAFLLDSRQGDQFAQLMLQQDRFRYAAFMINEHSRALLEGHQLLASHGVRQGQSLTDAQLTAALGPYVVMRLKVLLTATTLAVDQNLVSIQEQFRSLRALGKALFPGAPLIDADFVESPPKPPT